MYTIHVHDKWPFLYVSDENGFIPGVTGFTFSVSMGQGNGVDVTGTCEITRYKPVVPKPESSQIHYVWNEATASFETEVLSGPVRLMRSQDNGLEPSCTCGCTE